MGVILLYAFSLFIIISLAVRLAISPLLPKATETEADQQDYGLVKLRDMKVFDNSELEEIIELYNNKRNMEKDHLQLQKYSRVLSELKDIGYLTDEEYTKKMG